MAGLYSYPKVYSPALAVVAALVLGSMASAQTAGTAAIASPQIGEVLRGVVEIQGTAAAPGFASAELAFAYAEDDTHTWFQLGTIASPAFNSALGVWDTNAISDGEYLLRLRVNATDGGLWEAHVPVQVRNYTAPVVELPSATPTGLPPLHVPQPVVATPAVTTRQMTPMPPTPLPANPASLTATAVYSLFSRGAMVTVILILVIGITLLRRQA